MTEPEIENSQISDPTAPTEDRGVPFEHRTTAAALLIIPRMASNHAPATAIDGNYIKQIRRGQAGRQ